MKINNYNHCSFASKITLLLLFMLVATFERIYAQATTISTTTGTFVSNNGSSMSTFNFQNTNSYGVVIKGIEGVVGTSGASIAELWVKTSPISGAPGVITPANGWNLVITRTFTGVGNTSTTNNTTQSFFTDGDFIVPPGVTYGFCVAAKLTTATTTGTLRYYTQPAGTVIFAGGGCNIITGTNVSYGGTSVPPAAPTNTPRGFVGKVTFEPAINGYNNASVSDLVSPSKFCPSTQQVKARIKNNGKNIINSVNLNWELDGILQTPIAFASPLDTAGGTGIKDTVLTLGSIPFGTNTVKVLRIWTDLPNGVADTVTKDDTLYATIRPGLNGTYTIGNAATDYTSMGAAVADLNKYGTCGPVTFNVIAGSTFTENPIVLTQTGSPTSRIVFAKSGAGANPIVYGKNGAGTQDAVIAIAGASYITFDGIDVADSVSNTNATTQMEYGYAVVNTSATLGSTNDTIRNIKATMNRTNTTTIGLVQSTLTTATSLSGANHNNYYANIRVENSYAGILLQGTAAFPDSNNVITSTGGDTTIVGASTPNDIGNGTAITYGIECAEQKNVEVSKCMVRNVTHTASLIGSGIWLSNSNAASDYGTAKIYNNRVFNINRITIATGVAAAAMIGIRIEVALLAKALVYNNIVYGMSSANTTASVATAQTLRGISHGQTTGTGVAEYYHNSVSIDNANGATSVVGFWKGGTSNCIVKNNIFSVTSVANTSTAKHHAVYLNAGTITAAQNVYWSSPTANGFVGFAAADRTTLAQFAAATSALAPTDGNDLGSAFVNPNFTSLTNLDFSAATPAANSGTPITTPVSINTDINGNARNMAMPSIGAFETTQPLFDSAAPVISNIVIKSGSVPSIYATIKDNSAPFSAGNVNLWFRTGSTGAFASLAPDSTPLGSMNGNYKWGTSLSSLPVGVYQFYISARDLSGPGLNIAVNPIQASTFTNFGSSDPANYATNPDPAVNTRTFTKTAVLPGGTYAVGASAPTYIKLTDVANALNAAEVTGNLIFELQSDYDGTTGETYPIAFNQLITTGGNWTVTIRPAAGAIGRETSGYPGSAVPLISLNGADRITFDGRAGGIGSTSAWTLRAKRTAASTNSPCIQLTNGAQRNTIQYLKVESDNTTTTSGALVIGTTATTDGNSFNRLLNNTIGSRTDTASTTALSIYASGTAGATNDSNIVTGNSFPNWSTAGIHVTSTGNGANWQINNNHFYMSATQSTAQTAIRFEAGTAATGTRINGNFIGGTAINAGGTAWTNSVAGVWRGIVCAASLVDSVQIQNNTIQNINLTGGTGTYAAIEMTGALASIRNNTIGDATTANSIQTSQLGTIISIWLNNANNQALIEGNTIANVNSTGNTTAVGHNGIRITTAVTTAPLIIRNNSIFNLNAFNPTTGSNTASMIGILSIYAGTQQTIEKNAIYALGNSAQAATNVFGINVTNASGVGTILGNKIFNLNNTSNTATAQVVGIHLDLGTSWTVANNMIALGSNIDSSAIVSGIQDKTAGSNNIITFNSVLISGNALSTTATLSHAYRRTTAAITNIRNNIFQNIRTGGTANYAIANTNATPATGWNANYNVLNAATLSQVGLWNTTATDFSTWKATSLYDTASISTAATFVSTTDLHILSPTIGNVAFAGRPMTGITIDFDGQTRNAITPYMGADEIPASPLPVTLTAFTAHKQESNVLLKWSTASEINTTRFLLEASEDNQNYAEIASIKAKGNSNTQTGYSFMHKNAHESMNNASTIYYRLTAVDNDGTTALSGIVSVQFDEEQSGMEQLILFPNPVNSETQLNIPSAQQSSLHAEILDLQGRTLDVFNFTLIEGMNTIPMETLQTLKPGFYLLRATVDGEQKTIRFIK